MGARRARAQSRGTPTRDETDRRSEPFAFRHFIKPVARAPPARRPVCGRAAPSTRPSEGELSMAVVRPFRLPLLLLALGALVPTAGAQVSNKPIAGVTQPRVMTAMASTAAPDTSLVAAYSFDDVAGS